MPWQFHGSGPLFQQIAAHIRAEIFRGVYPPEAQVPSVRQLAFEASVNPNTMQRALSQLEEEGLLYTRGTIGRFVTSDEAVLNTARESVRKEAVQSMLREATQLGITREELIAYLQETKEGET